MAKSQCTAASSGVPTFPALGAAPELRKERVYRFGLRLLRKVLRAAGLGVAVAEAVQRQVARSLEACDVLCYGRLNLCKRHLHTSSHFSGCLSGTCCVLCALLQVDVWVSGLMFVWVSGLLFVDGWLMVGATMV